jgi:hypothetical protein
MKIVGRYIKWLLSGWTLFEWWMTSLYFFMAGGITATILKDEQLTHIWFTLALISAGLGVLYLMFKGFRHSWNCFKEDDDRVFNILKDKKDGQ